MKDPTNKRPIETCRKGAEFRCLSLEERFEKQIKRGTKDECWFWQGAKTTRGGYGNLLLNKRSMRAHRVSWMIANGPIPEGLHVLHKCDNPPCVNPHHLFLGTNQDNIEDARRKGRRKGPLPKNSNTCKITPEQAAEIRRIGKSVPRKAIAEKYGITVWHVSDIRTGDVWKNV